MTAHDPPVNAPRDRHRTPRMACPALQWLMLGLRLSSHCEREPCPHHQRHRPDAPHSFRTADSYVIQSVPTAPCAPRQHAPSPPIPPRVECVASSAFRVGPVSPVLRSLVNGDWAKNADPARCPGVHTRELFGIKEFTPVNSLARPARFYLPGGVVTATPMRGGRLALARMITDPDPHHDRSARMRQVHPALSDQR